jgi:hypothetical protein
MAASAVPPVRGQHALQEQDSTSPVSRGVEDLRMEGAVVQAGSYSKSRRGNDLLGQCHQAVGEGASVASGVSTSSAVCGTVRHATSTPARRARSFINALSQDGRCGEPRTERKTKDVCHRHRRRGHRVQKPRRRPVPPTTADAEPGLTPKGRVRAPQMAA